MQLVVFNFSSWVLSQSNDLYWQMFFPTESSSFFFLALKKWKMHMLFIHIHTYTSHYSAPYLFFYHLTYVTYKSWQKGWLSQQPPFHFYEYFHARIYGYRQYMR